MRVAHVAHVGHGVQRYFLVIRIIRYFDRGKEVDSDPCIELSVCMDIYSCPCLSKQGGSDVFSIVSKYQAFPINPLTAIEWWGRDSTLYQQHISHMYCI